MSRRPDALGDGICRALLSLSPRAFRMQFGQQVAQVFRDRCRQALGERGSIGLAGALLWMAADLVVTAGQEHYREISEMSRFTVARLSGWAAILGGGLLAFSMLVHMQGALRAAVPASILLLIVGTLGFYSLLPIGEYHLRAIGLALVGAGLVLGLIGMTGSALGVIYPNPAAPIINTGEHAGLVPIASGMLVWGMLAVRTQALGRWSFTPLLIGLVGLAGVVFISPPAFQWVEQGFIPIVFSGAWMSLGYGLLRTQARNRPIAA